MTTKLHTEIVEESLQEDISESEVLRTKIKTERSNISASNKQINILQHSINPNQEELDRIYNTIYNLSNDVDSTPHYIRINELRHIISPLQNTIYSLHVDINESRRKIDEYIEQILEIRRTSVKKHTTEVKKQFKHKYLKYKIKYLELN